MFLQQYVIKGFHDAMHLKVVQIALRRKPSPRAGAKTADGACVPPSTTM